MSPGMTRTLLALVLVGLTACGGGSSPDVLAGSGLDGPDRTLAWERQPVYTVGGAAAEGWAAFGDVEDVGFDAAGNLYVLDRQAAQIHVVSPDGTLLRSMGRAGEGPGELAMTGGMSVFADGAVAVFDMGKPGIVVYGPDGEWIRDVRVDPTTTGFLSTPFLPLPDRSLAAEVGGRVSTDPDFQPDPGQPVVRIPLEVDTGDPAVILTGWEAPPPGGDGEEATLRTEGGGNIMLQIERMRAFTPELHLAALRDGRILVVDSTSYRIGMHSPDGTFLEMLTRPIEPIPVTPSIEERERERRLEDLEESGGRGTLRVVSLGGSAGASMQAPDMTEMMRARIEDMVFYPEIQVIERLAADWNDRIWVQRASGSPGEPGPTDIITPDAEYVGTLPPDGLRIPEAFGPDGLAVWIERDEYDAERLVVARIGQAAG